MADDRTIAQNLLTTAWGEPIVLSVVDDLGGSNRSKVRRYAVQSSSQHPATVVVKVVATMQDETYAPDVAGGPAGRLFNEWAGLQFLSELNLDHALTPAFYAGDRDAGLIIIEDMGSGVQLDHLLLGDDAAAAEAGLLALMKSLGQLHAQTVGHADRYAQLRDRLGPQGATRTMPMDDVAKLQETIATFATAVLGDEWGVNSAEFTHLAAFLQPDNPFYAYGHQDACPDNCLLVDGEIKLLDLEFGGYRHALLDGVYARIHFPTCWCVNQIPPSIVTQMEQVYRQELSQGCAAAADDTLFAQAVAEACAWQQLTRLPTHLLERDQQWGIATLRQRTVLRLDLFAAVAEKASHLTSLGELAHTLSTALRQRWAADFEPMLLYPAFR